MKQTILSFLLAVLMYVGCSQVSNAQTLTGTDEQGNFTQLDEQGNFFNPHKNDTTKKHKEVPKGIWVWTIDRKLGDITKSEVDTVPHLYPQTTLAPGIYCDYNTTGSNYTARLSRIFIDRKETPQFIFTSLYDQVIKQPDEWHFTNSLSPITNLTYDNCGDKETGEDHIQGKFAVNAGKRLGMGFDLNYSYARGYYQNQSISHFGANVYGSYLGDKYQMHLLFSTYHEKATENGGITNDNYITHPELSIEQYSEEEIPTVLSENWNRNKTMKLFLTHRYSLGFYKEVRMTEEELKARQFAKESKRDNEDKNSKKKELKENNDGSSKKGRNTTTAAPTGRPDNARIAGKEPQDLKTKNIQPDSLASDTLSTDSTRIKVMSKEMADSLMAEERKRDSLAALMKKVYVPVTSFIHTLDLENAERIYQAYRTPDDYYANTYYRWNEHGYPGDSIYDRTHYFAMRNTAGLALLEGFNKWAKAGIKIFATHEFRKFELPSLSSYNGISIMEKWSEHTVSLGGRLSKTQGHTLHFLLSGETWLVGEDAGQLKIDFDTDLNFQLLGDTVHLMAKAYFHRLNPTFYQRHYHSKHLWWDNSLNKETRQRIEGTLAYDKTKTRLRVAIEEIQQYTYFGMSYDYTDEARTNLQAAVYQRSANLNVFTAQLMQDLQLGPLHFDNIVTYQSSSDTDVLPLPQLNLFSNLYLKFRVAQVLTVELGGALTYFTKYAAPDYLPLLGQFAVQQNTDSRVELGNFPFVDAYANLHLKHARFFIMMNNALASSANRMHFLSPHYPQNGSVLRVGVSWNFFN